MRGYAPAEVCPPAQLPTSLVVVASFVLALAPADCVSDVAYAVLQRFPLILIHSSIRLSREAL
jgi:hypothetical protein